MPVAYIMLTQVVHLDGSGEERVYSNTSDDLPWVIHPDDTVKQTKLKLVSLLECGPAEMMMFAFRTQSISVDAIYDDLSQGGTVPISRARLFATLSNIHPLNVEHVPNKDEYSHSDIVAMGIPTTGHIAFPIGIGFNVEQKYPVCANPFDVVEVDSTLVDRIKDIVSIQDAQVLLHYGTIERLYVVRAKDVAAYGERSDVSATALLSIYFPHLLLSNIVNSASLAVAHSTALQKALLEVKAFAGAWRVVDMFYQVAAEPSPVVRKEAGITKIEFVQHPGYDVTIPIDVLFKLIKSSATLPVVKYNAGSRMEKLFRLHAPNIAQNGKRIPELPKSKVAKIANDVAKDKGVGAYARGEGVELLFQFTPDGNIGITAQFIAPRTIIQVLENVREHLNHILTAINDYTQQSGYAYALFQSFGPNTEIVNIEYAEVLSLPSRTDVEKYKACVAPVFSIEKSSTDATILLSAVRVGYYNKMSAIDAFITRAVKRGETPVAVIQNLETSFDIERADAQQHMARWLSSVQVEQNAYRNKRLSVQSSAGIQIVMYIDRFSEDIVVKATDITQIGALPVLSAHIESLLRIGTKTALTPLGHKGIKAICQKGNIITDEPVFGNASLSPRLLGDISELRSAANELVFEEDQGDEDDLLDELFGEDELEFEEDDDDDIVARVLEEAEPSKVGVPVESGSLPQAHAPEGSSQATELTPPMGNIDGMSLTNPNYFFDRMYRKDPALFLKQGDGRYNAYSRLCPHNLRRQPVVVSDAEKERIEQENPDAVDFSKAVRYGSTPEKANWYICPRYWCLLDNSPMTDEQVAAGECGGKIIPFSAKSVPEGHYIYEFNAGTRNNEHIDKEGNYIQHYPGFLEADRHPSSKCIPCCFKGPWDKAALVSRRKQCMRPDEEDPSQQQKRSAAKEPAKSPLRAGERGFLLSSIEAVLNTRNVACQVSTKNRTLRSDHPCLLRQGVEQDNKQSFLAALGAVSTPELDIAGVRERITHITTAEVFANAQNGSLTAAFSKESDYPLSLSDGEITHSIDAHTESARHRFLDYINDPDAAIDYTYVWDIVSQHFLGEPFNIMVLEIPDDDDTDNVHLICPTNHYRSSYYDQTLGTLILVKKGEYYEPVFVYLDRAQTRAIDAQKEVIKLFSTSDRRIPLAERTAVQGLGRLLSGCAAEQMHNPAYIFKQGANAEASMHKLEAAGYRILRQVLNYNGKLVGLVARKGKNSAYVPVAPSGSVMGLETTAVNDSALWSRYKETYDALSMVERDTGLQVSPMVKVTQGGLVVGFLTKSDQFVQLSVPAEDVVPDGLLVRDADSTNDVDAVIFGEAGGDIERSAIMRRLALEREYFAAFRNTLRHILARPGSMQARASLLATIGSHTSYLAKLKDIETQLRSVGNRLIRFSTFDAAALETVDSISMCATKVECPSTQSCLSTDGECILVIPDSHLITGKENDKVYYGRVADELLRYPRIRAYLLERDTFLRLSKDDYDLGAEEIIVLSSVLFGSYYQDLVPRTTNALIAAPTYDDVVAAQSFAGIDQIIDLRDGTPSVPCSSVKKPLGSKEIWFSLLPDNTYVQRYSAIAPCGFDLLSVVASDVTASIVTREDIRIILAGEYRKILPAQQREVMATLRSQGKRNMMARYASGEIAMPDVVMTEEYWITNLDLRLICRVLRLPVVIISGSKVVDNKQRSLMTEPSKDSPSLVFIKQHGLQPDIVQSYSLLYHGSRLSFPRDRLSRETTALVTSTLGSDLFVRAKGRRLEVV